MAQPAPFEIINEIRQTAKTMKGQTHYERLGLELGADPVKVRKAYMKLAAKWHPDKYSQYDLKGAEDDLQRVFAMLGEAQNTLTNDRRREEYDAGLEWEKEEGTSTAPDVLAMVGADNSFRLGQQLLERGQLKAAHAQFKQAHQANKDSVEYNAYLGYTEFSMLPKKSDGVPKDRAKAERCMAKVEKAIDTMEDFEMGHVFLGNMHLAMKDRRQAIRQYKITLQFNPKNVQAGRQLRLLAMRQGEETFMDKIKGFFSRS